MISLYNSKFNLLSYKNMIGTKTNIHKVSYFFKKDLPSLSSKKILFLDFEFSMNKIIFEYGGFVLNNNKIETLLFKEFSLPNDEPYWDFNQDCFVSLPLNKDKKLFNDMDRDYLFSIIESVDYVVVHNYVAEAQCLLKLIFPTEKYNINNCRVFSQNKFICTNYSFKNKYFKSLGMETFSNSSISNFFKWELKDKPDKIIVNNKSLDISFKVNKPSGSKSKLHNSFYDSVITLTNFISLHKIYQKKL